MYYLFCKIYYNAKSLVGHSIDHNIITMFCVFFDVFVRKSMKLIILITLKFGVALLHTI